MTATRNPRLVAALSAAVFIAMAPSVVTAEDAFSTIVDAKGNITLPPGFRADMSHLGSWFVPSGDASGFHDVYTQQSTVQSYRETGKFPDGAILVKELRASRAADYTTGEGVHSATSKIKQWFVMVKDTKGRFADNPIWGEGWGWALYKPDAPEKNVATDYKKDCLGCHVPAKATDWVYTDAYPTLKAP